MDRVPLNPTSHEPPESKRETKFLTKVWESATLEEEFDVLCGGTSVRVVVHVFVVAKSVSSLSSIVVVVFFFFVVVSRNGAIGWTTNSGR